MSQLLYSEANISRSDLAHVQTPPALGRFHQPYPFAAYVDDVTEALDRIGYEVHAEEYEVTPDQQAFFGALEIAPREVEGEYIPAGHRTLVGVRGSHNQRIPRGLVLGSQVMVCSNLCFSGNIASFVSKQTKYLHRRLPGLINGAVENIPALVEQQNQTFDRYKDYEFGNPRHGDAALVEIFRQGGLSAAQLGKAVREWDKPCHDEHAEHGYSAWRLLNSVTEALKPGGERVNTNLIANRTDIATRFINNVVGVSALPLAA